MEVSSAAAAATSASGRHWAGVDAGWRRRRLGQRGREAGLGLGGVDRGRRGAPPRRASTRRPRSPPWAGASGTSGAEVGGDVVPSVTTAGGASGASDGAGLVASEGEGGGRKPRAPALGFEGKESGVRARDEVCGEGGGRRTSAGVSITRGATA